MTDSYNAGRGLKSTVSGKAARNDITGALIKTAPATEAYRNAPFWDALEAKQRQHRKDNPDV